MDPRHSAADEGVALRRGKARRSALLLACLAFALYIGFIAVQLLHGRRG
jgi:hypothetical protein